MATILAAGALLTGCASQQPLPYAYSPAHPAVAGAPTLIIKPTQDQRTAKDDLDKTLNIPKCLDDAMVTELGNSGWFTQVNLYLEAKTNGNYLLECSLNELTWEVPDYADKMETAAVVSVLTGAVGGLVYGSTKTDVNGQAKMRFVLSKEPGGVLLDKEYSATATERKIKFECDTPGTYREMAAKAFQKVLEQFKADLEARLQAVSPATAAVPPDATQPAAATPTTPGGT